MPAQAYSEESTAVVEKVEDGDTIVVNLDGNMQRVQLIGIDAPEDKQNPKLNVDSKRMNIKKAELIGMGELATKHLKSLIRVGEKVSLQGNLKQKDRYGRLPAIVINDENISLNLNMVDSGYALLLTRYPLQDALKANLKKAQKKAKDEKKGLWMSRPKLMEKWSN